MAFLWGGAFIPSRGTELESSNTAFHYLGSLIRKDPLSKMGIIKYVKEEDSIEIKSRPIFLKVILGIWKLEEYIAPRVKSRYMVIILNSMKGFFRK